MLWVIACTGEKDTALVGEVDTAIIVFGEQQTCPGEEHRWSFLQDQARSRGVQVDIAPHSSREECDYTPGSVVVQDLDGDGFLDILFGEYMSTPYAFRNDGTGHFSEIELGLTVYDSARLNLGLAAVDITGDSLPELIMSGAGYVVFAENLGDFRFGQWQVILDQPEYPRPCYNAFHLGDFDQDQDLDIFIGGLDLAAYEGDFVSFEMEEWKGSHDILMENDGGSWAVVGEFSPWGERPGLSFLQRFTDVDNDGDLDILASSDRVVPEQLPPMALWQNSAEKTGRDQWTDIGAETGADLPISGMGLGVHDLNQDGFLDYCFSDIQGRLPCLISDGFGSFYEGGRQLGLEVNYETHPEIPMEWLYESEYNTTWIGWGLAMTDLNNDGFLDVVTAAGVVPDGGSVALSDVGYWQPDWLWEGSANGFSEVLPSQHALANAESHYGLVAADLEQDGHLELVIGVHGGNPLIFTNPCGQGHWLNVELVGSGLNAEGFGARVILTRNNGQQDIQEMSNLHTVSQAPSQLHFGLGAELSVQKIEVIWPDGKRSVAHNFEGDRIITIYHSEQ